jgi:hypothetical protein
VTLNLKTNKPGGFARPLVSKPSNLGSECNRSTNGQSIQLEQCETTFVERRGHELTTDRNAFDLYTLRSLRYSTHLPAADYFYRKVFIASMFSPAWLPCTGGTNPVARYTPLLLPLSIRASCCSEKKMRALFAANGADATAPKHVEGCLHAALSGLSQPRL